MKLLPPAAEVGTIGEAMIPADLYFVARDPVALVGMGYPARVDWRALHAAGVGHVVCLTHDDPPPYDCTPLRCTAIALTDLYSRPVGPSDRFEERRRVEQAAAAAVESITAGVGVAVHCRGGRGRTGTVIGLVLVHFGHRPERVVDYLDRLHRARGKDGWPESPWQAAVVMGQA